MLNIFCFREYVGLSQDQSEIVQPMQVALLFIASVAAFYGAYVDIRTKIRVKICPHKINTASDSYKNMTFLKDRFNIYFKPVLTYSSYKNHK